MTLPLSLNDDDWLSLLQQAVAADPRGRAGVAQRLGLSRSALSMVMAGSYPASTAHIAARVVELLVPRPTCPHTGEPLARTTCAVFSAAAPINSPREMRQWRTCQTCGHKPKE